MKKSFYLVASISTLIVALSIAYYLVIFLPSKEMARQELETKKLLQGEQEQFSEEEEAKEGKQAYKDCELEAIKRAKSLLKTKVELMEGSNSTHTIQYTTLKEGSEKGLFLKDDYDYAYENCLRSHGLKY